MTAERCTGVVFWRNVHGILLKSKDGYSGFCPVCDKTVVQKRKPREGQRCAFEQTPGLPCKSEVNPPQQVSGRECGRPCEEGRWYCESHLPVETLKVQTKVENLKRALRCAEGELRELQRRPQRVR